MSNTVIGALRVMLGMDTAEFEKGATSTQRTLQRMESNFAATAARFQKIGAGMTKAITAPLAALGVAGAAAANQLAQDSERMQRAAQTAGAGFEEFQRAAHAAYAGAGVDSEKFADILRDTQDKIGEFAATGGGEMKDFFEKIAAPQGLTVEDFIGKSSIEQLQLFVSSLERAGVPSEQMVFYLESIADEGSALYHILKNNGAALEELGKKAAVIDPKAAAELKAYSDAQKELDTSTRKLTIALAKSGLMDMLASAAEKLANFVSEFAEANPNLFRFTVVAGGVAAALGPISYAFGGLVKAAPLLVNAFKAVRVAALFLMANPAIIGFAAVLGGIYLAWKNWDKITAIVQRLYTGVKTWMMDKLGAIFDWVGNKIKAVTGFFYNMYDAVVGNSYVPDMVDGIGAEFARLQGLMVDPAEKAAKGTEEAFRTMAGNVLSLLDRLFPEMAAARQQAEDLALLDGAGLSEDVRQRARMRLLGGGRDRPKVSDGLLNEGPIVGAGQLDGVSEGLAAIAEPLASTVDKSAQWRDILGSISSSFGGVAGDIANAVSSIIVPAFDRGTDAVSRMGEAMRGLTDLFQSIFGRKAGRIIGGIFQVAASVARAFSPGGVPAFANGGAMQLGGFAGVDRNVLSLNGSPIARVSAGETMQIRPVNDPGGGRGDALRVTVTMDESTGALGAFVRNAAGQVVAQAVPSIVRASSEYTLGRADQRAQRMLR